MTGEVPDRPPAWEFSARETAWLCSAIRRVRYPNSAWKPMPATEGELDELLDRLFEYLGKRQRWENLFLPSLDDTPF